MQLWVQYSLKLQDPALIRTVQLGTMYMNLLQIEPTSLQDTARMMEPWPIRDYYHFCSH